MKTSSVVLQLTPNILSLFFLNEGIMKCLDTYYNINIVRQHKCFYYTR